MLPIVQFTVFKIRFPILFSVLLWNEKILSFLTFSWDKERLQSQSYSILGRKKQPPLPPLAPLGADRSFIIGTEIV